VIWADRLAIVCALIVAIIITTLTATTPGVSISSAPYDAIVGTAIAVGMPWLLLRGIDFAVTGRIRGRRPPLVTVELAPPAWDRDGTTGSRQRPLGSSPRFGKGLRPSSSA